MNGMDPSGANVTSYNSLYTTILRQWCNMRDITDVYLGFFHRHWLHKHDVSKADYSAPEDESSVFSKRRVCVISKGKAIPLQAWTGP
jgi:hypothetical protein